MAARNLTLAIVARWRTGTEVQVAPFLGNQRCASARGGTRSNRYKGGAWHGQPSARFPTLPGGPQGSWWIALRWRRDGPRQAATPAVRQGCRSEQTDQHQGRRYRDHQRAAYH